MILSVSNPRAMNGLGFTTTKTLDNGGFVGPVDNEVYGLLDNVMSIQAANDAAYQYYKTQDPISQFNSDQWKTIIGIGIGVILLAMLLRR